MRFECESESEDRTEPSPIGMGVGVGVGMLGTGMNGRECEEGSETRYGDVIFLWVGLGWIGLGWEGMWNV